MPLLNNDANRRDWGITAPTLNVTKVGGLFAAIITPAGGALAALLKSMAGAPDSIVIAILAVVGVVILATTVIVGLDIHVRGMGARAARQGGGTGIVPLTRGFEVTVAGQGPARLRALALREDPSNAGQLEYLIVGCGPAAPEWRAATEVTVVGAGAARMRGRDHLGRVA